MALNSAGRIILPGPPTEDNHAATKLWVETLFASVASGGGHFGTYSTNAGALAGNYTGIVQNDIVAVYGYYSAFDRAGMRYFRCVTNSSLEHNGGTVLKPTGAATPGVRLVLIRQHDTYDPTAFGAKGDNSQNDAPFFQTMLDVIGSSGGTIEIPDGHYDFDDGVQSSTNLLTVVAKSSRRRAYNESFPSTGVYLNASETLAGKATEDLKEMFRIRANGTTEVRFSGPYFEGINFRDLSDPANTEQVGRGNNVYGVRMNCSNDSKFLRCSFIGFKEGIVNISMHPNSGHSGTRYGLGATSGKPDASWGSVKECTFLDNAIGYHSPHGGGVVIDDCRFQMMRPNQAGILIAGGGQTRIINNKVDGHASSNPPFNNAEGSVFADLASSYGVMDNNLTEDIDTVFRFRKNALSWSGSHNTVTNTTCENPAIANTVIIENAENCNGNRERNNRGYGGKFTVVAGTGANLVNSESSGSSSTDHGALSGRADDDHSQYSRYTFSPSAPASPRVGDIWIEGGS